MRFCAIGPVYPYRGGIAHFTTMLAKAMRECGHDVLVVSYKRQYPRWLHPGETDKDPSQNPLTVSDAQYWLDSLSPLTWLSTFFRIRRSCPDVTVMQWWTPFWTPTWFALGASNRLLLQIPTAFYCHNVLPHETRRWDACIAKATLHCATLFLVQTAEEEGRLQALLPRATIQVTPLPSFDMFGDLRIPRDGARRMAVTYVPIRTRPQTRQSRLIRSIPSFLGISAVTIARFYTMYRPLRVFTTLGGLFILGAVALGVRLVVFFLQRGGTGNIQSLILAAILTIIGFEICLIGLITDLIGQNRRMTEETLFDAEHRSCEFTTSLPGHQNGAFYSVTG